MSAPVFGNMGIRRILDQNMRFFRGGLTAYLRIKNFVDNEAFADMGFQFVPVSSGAQVPTGTTDILIDPPPSVRLISVHTLAFAQQAGVELRGGARSVTLSHTWVVAQMQAQWFLDACAAANLDPTDPKNVFKNPQVLGIVTDKLLLEAVDITHEEVYGEPMSWFLRCNSSEISNS